MWLGVEVLESRNCAALVDLAQLGGGMLRAFDGTPFMPFPDFPGPVHGVYSPASGEGKVAPGDRGGPRVETVDAHGVRQGNDVFADGADPASRAGVVFVGVDDTPPPPARRTLGTGYPVFLDGGPADLVEGVYGLLAPAGDVEVTNVRPPLPPGDYATVIVGLLIPPEFDEGVLGVADVGAVARPHGPFQSPTALVGPPDAVEVTAHEVGHEFGLTHVEGDPLDVMSRAQVAGQRFSPAEIARIRDVADTARSHNV